MQTRPDQAGAGWASAGRGERFSSRNLRLAAIAIAGAAAFAVTLQVSVAGVFNGTRPQIALKMAPWNATARSKLAGQLIGSQDADARLAARGLALDAIRRDPIQPVASRVLGLTIDKGDPASQQKAAAFMLESLRLSRRDAPTHVWLIEWYGRQGNLDAMVRHFDLVLRFSESARSQMFPLLTSAAADPAVRDILLRTLSAKPNWAVQFASHSALWGHDLDFAATIVPLLLNPDDAMHGPQYTTLLNRLAQSGHYATAWRLYNDPRLGLRKGGGSAIRNIGFELREDGSPFDWSYAQEADLAASKERLGANSIVRTLAYNGRSGEVAWQVLRLPAGMHKLQARVGDVPSDRFERPELRIDCVGEGDGNRIAAISPSSGGGGPSRVEARFVVPPGCVFQRLSIRASGAGALRDPSPWVDDIRIE